MSVGRGGFWVTLTTHGWFSTALVRWALDMDPSTVSYRGLSATGDSGPPGTLSHRGLCATGVLVPQSAVGVMLDSRLQTPTMLASWRCSEATCAVGAATKERVISRCRSPSVCWPPPISWWAYLQRDGLSNIIANPADTGDPAPITSPLLEIVSHPIHALSMSVRPSS